MSDLQELGAQVVISQELLLQLLGVQRISLIDGLCEVSLGPVVQLLDFVNLIRVEDVLVADFLEEPNGDEFRPLDYLERCSNFKLTLEEAVAEPWRVV